MPSTGSTPLRFSLSYSLRRESLCNLPFSITSFPRSVASLLAGYSDTAVSINVCLQSSTYTQIPPIALLSATVNCRIPDQDLSLSAHLSTAGGMFSLLSLSSGFRSYLDGSCAITFSHSSPVEYSSYSTRDNSRAAVLIHLAVLLPFCPSPTPSLSPTLSPLLLVFPASLTLCFCASYLTPTSPSL